MNNKEQLWYDALVERGHTPAILNEELDIFFYGGGYYHNGPGCSVCGWGCCWHCDRVGVIPECSEKYPS